MPRAQSDAAGPEAADFDRQAAAFDRRAGLPTAAAREVARVLKALALPAAGSRLLDLGAGTGAIGRFLDDRAVTYIGLDRSLSMLRVFMQSKEVHRPRLLCADADRTWPLADRSVDVVFASRAAHLLDSEHLVRETLRVGRPRACVVLGRVERLSESIRSTMRKTMRRLLAEHGIEGRSGRNRQKDFMKNLEARGAEPVATHTVARWPVSETPEMSIQAWCGKSGLAGHQVDPAIKREVLDRLEAWAREHYGALDARSLSEERYTLTATRLPEAA